MAERVTDLVARRLGVTAKSTTGILAFKVNSDGTTTQVGGKVGFNQGNLTVLGTATTEKVSVVPNTMVIDAAGKFLELALFNRLQRAKTDLGAMGNLLKRQSSVVTDRS